MNCILKLSAIPTEIFYSFTSVFILILAKIKVHLVKYVSSNSHLRVQLTVPLLGMLCILDRDG